jgi:hypothetical protein
VCLCARPRSIRPAPFLATDRVTRAIRAAGEDIASPAVLGDLVCADRGCERQTERTGAYGFGTAQRLGRPCPRPSRARRVGCGSGPRRVRSSRCGVRRRARRRCRREVTAASRLRQATVTSTTRTPPCRSAPPRQASPRTHRLPGLDPHVDVRSPARLGGRKFRREMLFSRPEDSRLCLEFRVGGYARGLEFTELLELGEHVAGVGRGFRLRRPSRVGILRWRSLLLCFRLLLRFPASPPALLTAGYSSRDCCSRMRIDREGVDTHPVHG